MQDLGRRSGGSASDRATGGAANQLAPGHKTLVQAIDFAPETSSKAIDNDATATQPDQTSDITRASTPDAAASATGPLSPSQVAAAIQFHTVQPTKYKKAVIADIQGAVGIAPTGVMNAATVQAIATRQAAVNADRNPMPPLKVDGKAGPRTLPILKQVGLATDEAIDAYTADVQAMDGLDKAKPEELAERLLAELNLQLKAVGVPGLNQHDKVKIEPHFSGLITKNWTLTMSRKFLTDPSGPEVAAAAMYHEARHAEQVFRVARMLAGKHYGASEIAHELELERSIANDAVTKVPPLKPGTTEAVEAEGWHDDEAGEAQKRAAFAAVQKTFLAALLELKKDPKNQQKRDHADKLYRAYQVGYVTGYRDTPQEYDAFFLEDKLRSKLGAPDGHEFPLLDDVLKDLDE